MIVYNYKGRKFNFWLNINTLGNCKWFGHKPLHCKECMKDPECIRKYKYYNNEMNIVLVPYIQFGKREYIQCYYFTASWLIFDFGISLKFFVNSRDYMYLQFKYLNIIPSYVKCNHEDGIYTTFKWLFIEIHFFKKYFS